MKMKSSGEPDLFKELYNYTVLLKAVAYILERKSGKHFFSNKLEIQMQHLFYIQERINQYMQSVEGLPTEIYYDRSRGLNHLRQAMPFRGAWAASLPDEWLQCDEDVAGGSSVSTQSQLRHIFYSGHPARPFINTKLGVLKIMGKKEN